MNKKLLMILALFLSACVLSVPIELSVSATSYYNWIYNSSFESNIQMVEDGTFESDSFNTGLVYGNFSIASGSPSFTSSYSYEGIYSLTTSSSNIAWYNFSDSYKPIGADIIELSFYAYSSNGVNPKIYIYYEDGSSDYDDWNTAITAWEKVDATSLVDDSKTVVAIRLLSDSTAWLLYDNVVCYAGSGGIDSQSTLDYDTNPWFTPAFEPVGDSLTTDEAHSGLSCWGIGIGLGSNTAQQHIINLDSDSVKYVNLFYNSTSATGSIKITFYYTDTSYSEKEMDIEVSGSWTELNFGQYWVSSGKIISGIRITVDTDYYVYIDDVGIWCDVPRGFNFYGWSLSPAPLAGYYNNVASCYMNTPYTLTVVFYNASGSIWEVNGTYTLICDKGFSNGTITDGTFTYSITARTGLNTYVESFQFVAVLDDNAIPFEIRLYWTKTSSSTPPPEEQSGDMISWLVMFMVIFLPALMFSGGIYENNKQPDAMHISPVFGIIAGLCLSIGIGVYTTLVPLWMLILIIVAIVLLIVGMVRQ